MYRANRMAAICLWLLVLAAITGCSGWTPEPEPLPEDTIEEFEDAINAMDVNSMLDCMDEDAVKSVTVGMDIMMGVAESVTGFSLGLSGEDLIAAMPLMQGIVGTQMPGEAYPQVDFQVTRTYIKGDKATVFLDEANSGESMAINMKKNDGKWQITFHLVPVEEEEADRILIAGSQTEPSTEADRVLIAGEGEKTTGIQPEQTAEEDLTSRESGSASPLQNTEEPAESDGNAQEEQGSSLLDVLSGEALKDYLRERLEGTE